MCICNILEFLIAVDISGQQFCTIMSESSEQLHMVVDPLPKQINWGHWYSLQTIRFNWLIYKLSVSSKALRGDNFKLLQPSNNIYLIRIPLPNSNSNPDSYGVWVPLSDLRLVTFLLEWFKQEQISGWLCVQSTDFIVQWQKCKAKGHTLTPPLHFNC